MTNIREALKRARLYIATHRDDLLRDFCVLNDERVPDRSTMDADEAEIVAEADAEIAALDAALSALPHDVALREACNRILPYLRWTIGPESPGHHPTMPSAVTEFEHALSGDPGEAKSSDGGVEGHAAGAIGQRGLTGADRKCQPARQEGETTLPAGIKPGPSDSFNDGLETAARWHDEEATRARAIYSEMDRYSDDHEERAGWRSYKDKEDRHRTFAWWIRSLRRPVAQGDAQ